MSASLGLEVLDENYRAGRIPVMEFLHGFSREAIRHFTGIDPLAERHRLNEAFRKLNQVWEVDLLWGGGLPDNQAEVFDWSDGQKVKRNGEGLTGVQWGIFITAHQEDGRHFMHVPKPSGVEEALDFQPLKFFPHGVDEYQHDFQKQYDRALASTGDGALVLPNHYTTAFHWPLGIFGFELLCEAGLEEVRFARLMERFAEVSRRITTAWSRVEGLKGFILHDDLTMTSGPIFAPEWYRRHIFVHYPSIFRPLIEKKIPIVFTSDGDCSMFVDDIFAAGASGLNFEACVELEPLVRRYPDKILMGGFDPRIIGEGPSERIEEYVRQQMQIGSRCRRFVANAGHLTQIVPTHHLECYLNLRRELSRSMRNGINAAAE